jgi:predicted ATPase/class 3 adenylate cyclase
MLGAMSAPSGTVTFLFTDIEGSTRLWQADETAMRAAVSRHDELIRKTVAEHGGTVFSTGGDGFGVAFPAASTALAAALAAQRILESEEWPTANPLRARMGIHTGEAELRDGDYFGTAVNRAARLTAIGHGGQVLVSSLTAELLGDGVALVDLGEQRLRDLDRPMQVFQAGEGSFSRLQSLDAFPGNLPLQVTSFVGREEERVRVRQALEPSRVVTLTGVGGVGKTRLALQVAAEVLPRFKDGAWLCELASLRDPDRLADAVAGVFKVSARPGRTLEESLLAYLSDQDLVLVLDNCEHLLRPVASLVAHIERACPGVAVLATSREGLNVRGEQILVVPSLGLPDDVHDIEVLAVCEAVQLFTDRARAVKADFAVDRSNAQGVAEICVRLDGVPLAIELAAARIGAMNPSELARRLDQRFRLLTGGDRVAIERHQTLRATIDWSYELLSASERRLLGRLSVFADGCTLEAAEAVCGHDPIEVDDVLDLLATLVARSLVVAHDSGPDTRYRLLETIRQYGEERLVNAGETDAMRGRHCDYYAEFAGQATREFYGPGQLEWGIRMAAEHDNMYLAMAFALDSQDLERALRLLCAVPPHWQQIDDPVAFDPKAVLALPGSLDHPGSARALMDSARRAWETGDYTLGIELADQAVELEERLGPCPGNVRLDIHRSNLRAVIATSVDRPDESAEWYFDAAERARSAGQDGLAAWELGGSAISLAWTDPDTAIARANQGLTLAGRAGGPISISANQLALALALAPSDPQRAATLLREADAFAFNNALHLLTVVFASGRLADWPATLRAAGRLLDLDRRSGTSARVALAGLFNFVARGLAETQPESAAVLQGAVRALLPPRVPQKSSLNTESGRPNSRAELMVRVRREATQLVARAVGETRTRDLRIQGERMDRDQACAFARTHIHDYLTAHPAR